MFGVLTVTCSRSRCRADRTRVGRLPPELRAALPSLEAVRAELEAAPLDDAPADHDPTTA